MKRYGVFLFALLLTAGCEETGGETADNGEILLTVEPYTSDCVSDPLDVDTSGDDETITHDQQAVLDCQVEYAGNEDLAVAPDGDQAALTATASSPILMKLVATVAAPVVNGTPLGASDVFFNGTQAIVTYNTPGEPYQGAMQVVDLSTPTRPRLVSQTVFKDTDISTGFMDGLALYLAGAQSVDITGQPDPAQIQRVDLTTLLVPFLFSGVVPLPSFVGTDVIRTGAYVYVATGDDGGLEKLNALTLSPVDFMDLHDARSLALNDAGTTLYVFQGTPGRVAAVNLANFTQTSFAVGGATIPQSKGTVEFASNLLFLGAGDGGALIANPATQQVVATIANPARSDLAANLQVTNAVTVQENLMFLSNGQAGVRAAYWNRAPSGAVSTQMIGTLNFFNNISANAIAYRGDFLVVASGTEGLRIIKVIRSPYLQSYTCKDINAVFCDDFNRTSGTAINDDIKWEGKQKAPKVSGTIIGQGGRLESKSYIQTVPSFSHTATAKHYSAKLFRATQFNVWSAKHQNFGVGMTYDGVSTVQVKVGNANSSSVIPLKFTFPEDQSVIVAHVYQQGGFIKVGVELSDGTMMESAVLTVLDLKTVEDTEIEIMPIDDNAQSTTTPSFDDVLVENYSF